MQRQHLHRVDRELLDRARAAFKPTKIDPTTDLNKIMFEAGAVKLLDWLENEIVKSASKTTVRNAEDVDLGTSHEGFLRRLAKGDA